MTNQEVLEVSPTQSTAEALRLTKVTRTFPGVRALDNVDLIVTYGEVHGVLGENGAGKSTLMAIASGALSADEGTVTVAGQMLTAADPMRARELGLAIVRQEPALMPDLTVAENLYLGVSPDKRPGSHDIEKWADSKLALWGENVPVRSGDRVEQLHPQQRFIVEIVRALSQDPDVLVLDEPTEHLLKDEVEILFGHIRAHTARGKAVVYISHRIHEVKQITDRITVLRNGRTVGTFDAPDMTEEQIVGLIIGRDLDVYFPDKRDRSVETPVVLELDNFATKGLDPLSISFRKGEIIGLAGIEGNGQRELIRALAAVERSSGGVMISGRRYSRYNHKVMAKNNVVYLPGDRHNEGILTGLSVRENIAYRNFKVLGPGGFVRSRREKELVTGVISDYNVKTPSLDTPIDSLSGGNQQKALIGSALTGKPTLFLVDEPTQGVDIGARSEIYALMRQAADDGAVVIMLSSDAAELAGVADRVLVFSRGHVISQIEGDDLDERHITGAALTSDTERERSGVASRHRVANWLAGDQAPVAVVSVIIIAMTLVGIISNPLFVGYYNINGMLALAATLGFVAFGQLFVLLTGGIDISVGPVVGLVVNIASFYLIDGATISQQLGGWGLMFGAALFVGFINWVLIDFVKLSPLIATLITYMGVQGVSFVLRPSPGGTISSTITDAITTSLGPIPVTFIVLLGIGIGLGIALKRSRPGIIIRAVGSREESARVNGLHPKRVRLLAYLACSFFAALGGVLFMAQTATGDAAGGVNLTLLSITAAVVGGASVFGGRGSFIGALLGALLVQVVSSLTVFLRVSSDWQFYLVGLMTIGAVALYSIARRRAAVRH
ncbi:MAG: transporter [Subtercola sp.]|nr:transporter [Subtercola sp.]